MTILLDHYYGHVSSRMERGEGEKLLNTQKFPDKVRDMYKVVYKCVSTIQKRAIEDDNRETNIIRPKFMIEHYVLC